VLTANVEIKPQQVVVSGEQSPVFVTGAEQHPVVVSELQPSVVEAEKVKQVVVQQGNKEVYILAVGMQGPGGTGGGSSVGAVEAYTAGMDLGGHRVIVTDPADGRAIYADNTIAAHANAATKITLGAAVEDAEIEAQLVGRITEPSWNWTPNGTIYVGQNGMLTQTPPVAPAVFSKPIAVAETATRILLIQEPPIML
jgi:hypothetical protein